MKFKLHCPYKATEHQQMAIDQLLQGLHDQNRYQTLKGITGSGKTYMMAKVIESYQRPTLVLSHNKTLAAQLYREFKNFFPENAVEYFVSYHDYYQPEAYVASRDLYIKKDTAINQDIEMLARSATNALLSRQDVIVVATVASIYGLGNPNFYQKMGYLVRKGESQQKVFMQHLVQAQYERQQILQAGSFRVVGEQIQLWPSYSKQCLYFYWDWDQLVKIALVDPLKGIELQEVDQIFIFPNKLFTVDKSIMDQAIQGIKTELKQRHEWFIQNGQLLEAQRLKMRTQEDLMMMEEMGYCSGIENYSLYLTQRKTGQRPYTLLDYFPKQYLSFLDESHVLLGQLSAMYNGDRSRKQTLVDYGFRLPSALDNRPLTYQEFDELSHQIIYVSATPHPTEMERSTQVVEQIYRPTGLLDPEIFVKPTQGQIDDLCAHIQKTIAQGYAVFVTTLTKKMAEDLSQYLSETGILVQYLHSEIDVFERSEILHKLRKGSLQVIVGVNLLREGLDIPEVALVAIMDADKIGFLRSTTALIQTIGRAARNAHGYVLMYADQISESMAQAIAQTQRNRALQIEYNREKGIVPETILKKIDPLLDNKRSTSEWVEKNKKQYNLLDSKQKQNYISLLKKQMLQASEDLEFEKAAQLRDQIKQLEQ